MDNILVIILGWELFKYTIRRMCKPFPFIKINQKKENG